MTRFHRNNSIPPFPAAKICRTLLASCIVAASAPVVVQAQEQVVEEVVVRGMRASLRTAQDIKREADTFVDGISALDIGALPDRSVLEAMQRIPGVSIERVGEAWTDYYSVEGRGAVIRGMSATRSEFNGREAFHASGRGLSFGDIPPELMAGIDIYKNQTADMIEGGIGGTVSLRTRKPFDQQGQLFAMNAEGSWGDINQEWNPSASALYSNRWQTDAGEFGFLIQLQDSKRRAVSHAVHMTAFLPYQASVLPGAESFVGDGSGEVLMPTGANFMLKDDEMETSGGIASFQWKDNDDKYLLTLEHIRSDSKYNYFVDWLRFLGGTGPSSQNIRPLAGTEFQFDDNGLFQSGTLTQANFGWRASGIIGPNVDEPNTRQPNPYTPRPFYPGDPGGMAQFGTSFNLMTERNESSRKLEDTSLNFVWTPDDTWTVEFDYQHIDAWQDADLQQMAGNVPAVQQLDLSGSQPHLRLIEPFHGDRDNNPAAYNNGLNRPGWTNDPQGDANYFQDPTSYGLQDALDIFGRNSGDSDAVRIDVDYALNDSWITNIKGGVRWNERTQLRNTDPFVWGGLAPTWAAGALYQDHVAAVAEEYGMFETRDWSDFQRGGVLDIDGGNQTRSFSHQYVQRVLDGGICEGEPGFVPTSAAGTWRGGHRCRDGVDSKYGMFLEDAVSHAKETNTAAYARLDFAFENLPKRVAGNIGLRYVELERNATGFVHSPSLDENFAGTSSVLPAGQTLPLTGPGVLAFAQSQVDAGNYAQLDDFYTSLDNQWVSQAFWYLSDAERAFATESSMAQSASTKYTAWLPSLNVKVELADDLIGRFAVSKAMAQPSMNDIHNTVTATARLDVVPGIPADVTNAARWETAAQSASVIGWEGYGGNPFLEPMESIQYDASLEWYFADASSLTGTLFYKDLSNFFIYGANPRQLTNGLTGQTQTAQVESRTNGGDGKMYGYELAYTQFFDMLPSFWSGLGMQANYTWIKASGVPPYIDTSAADPSLYNYIEPVDVSSVPLVGQSEHTANLVLMYQRDDWSGRIAYNWRSEYLVSYRDGITLLPVWQTANGVMDASLTWNVNDNLSLVLQGNNLLDTQPKLEYIIDAQENRAGKSWFVAERMALFGARLRF